MYRNDSTFARKHSTLAHTVCSPHTHRVRHYGCLMQPRAVATDTGRISVIENASHRVVYPQRLLVLSALALRLLDASSFQCSHRVIPTVLLFLERYLSPLSGLNGCPSGSYYYSRPPPARAVSLSAGPACRRCPPNSGGQRRDSAAGSLDAPRFAPTLADASGIPPALQWVFLSFLICILLLVLVRNS